MDRLLRKPRACASRSAASMRAAGRLHLRQHGVGGAVQDRHDARDAIAGEPVGDCADDRHRAADRRFEAQLTALARGERQQRGAVARHHLLVGGDDRLAGEQRRANPAGGRLEAADRFDDDVGVAAKDVVDARGPDGRRRPCAGDARFCVRASIENVGEAKAGPSGLEAVRRCAPRPIRRCQNPGTPHENRNSLVVSLISPRDERGRNWHLNRDRRSRGCRGVAGPVPQPLLMKRVIRCPSTRRL